ncbi:MAG: site-specific integrase, partial [Gaiellales bacterium]
MPEQTGSSTELDPALRGFLALLATRRAPRTVDAYRRDLSGLSTFLGAPASTASAGDLERWMADLRARGLAASSTARKLAAARALFRHLVLIGQRDDNPAAELEAPRRRRKLPRPLSMREVERLCDAANGL